MTSVVDRPIGSRTKIGGSDGGMTFREIGKELCISESRVRQIYNKALSKIRKEVAK